MYVIKQGHNVRGFMESPPYSYRWCSQPHLAWCRHRILEQELANYASSLFLSVKLHWNIIMLICLYVVYHCFHVTVVELNSCIEAGWLTKSRIFLYRPLQKKVYHPHCRGRILLPFQLALDNQNSLRSTSLRHMPKNSDYRPP